jgi:glucokinase
VKRVVVAADIGGTNLRAALVDESGQVFARRERPTPREGDGVVDAIATLMGQVAGASAHAPLAAGIGSPGLVDGDAGMVILAPNIPSFRNLALAAPIAERLSIPAFVENDASAAALGEFHFGAGRGTRHLLHATLGTGIGGGIVINGRLYRGARGFAGEIGHVVIDPAGPRCNCGSRGCLEALVSGVAFSARAKKLIQSGGSPVLLEIVGYREPSAADLHAAALAGDRQCEAEIRNGGHLLGIALGGMVNVLNPDMVTLSGGLLQMGEMLLRPLREAMFSIAYGPASGTTLATTVLDDDAGLLGAAAVAFERIAAVVHAR